MKFLWVGLGNPGYQYQNTRHNIGSNVLLSLFSFASLKKNQKLQSFVAKSLWQEHSVTLLFPQTYMNLSGQAVQAALKKETIQPQNMLVFHDEIELLPQDIRYKFSGGHKGHNGLRNIISCIGTADFHRIRIGVGRSENPSMSVADYVLSRYPQEDFPAQEKILQVLEEFLQSPKLC